MQTKQIILLVFIGLLLLISFNTFYTVHETRQAIVLQFGRPVGEPITQAGLKIKIPFIFVPPLIPFTSIFANVAIKIIVSKNDGINFKASCGLDNK